jgi:ketosteroid isomerase-like protein
MTAAGDIHRSVEAAFNVGDTEALVALYEEKAVMATSNGTFVNGRDAIREQRVVIWMFPPNATKPDHLHSCFALTCHNSS